MKTLRRLLKRLTSWARTRRDEERLRTEIEAHIALQTQDNLHAGMPADEARRQAVLKFGAVEAIKEDYRDQRGLPFLEALLHDTRYALRRLRKSPGFTVTVVLTLALGIGATTAMFSMVNAVLLEPLPFHNPTRLVELWETEEAPGDYPLTGGDYLDWKAQNHTLAATSVFSWPSQENLSLANEAVPATVSNVQENFFSTLGVQPLLGRTFAKGEDTAGLNRVAVLSYSIWQQELGGRRDILGKTIELNAQSYTVVGIMPRSFTFGVRSGDVYVPLDMSPKNLGGHDNHQWQAIARLRAGVTARQAGEDLTAIEKRLGKLYPNHDAGVKTVVIPFQENIRSGSRAELFILLAAVVFVLFIACANIAGLMLARATNRSHEMALRVAMGASRWRLIRQLLTESVTLALAGGAAGLLVAYWIVQYLQTARSLPIPRFHPITVDFRVLLFAFAVSVFAGILFGLAPALQPWDVGLIEQLKSASQSVLGSQGSRQSFRDALIVGEVALSLALLVGAGLLLRTFARMHDANIGVERQGLLTMGLSLPDARYPKAAERRVFLDRLLAKVQHTPGVRFAAVSSEIPLDGGTNGYITAPGNNNPAFAKQLVEWNLISADYFRSYGIPLLRGRDFTPEDMQHAADVGAKIWALYQAAHGDLKTIPPDLTLPAIINLSMARTFWPNQNPIGKVFEGGLGREEVTGVVGNVNEFQITEKAFPEAYFPFPAGLDFESVGHLTIRIGLAPLSLLGAIRHDVAMLDSSLAINHPRTVEQLIADHMSATSLQTFLLGLFAALALFLAAIGIFGVMAYLVARRTREFGIRMALGAQRGDVLKLVVARGLKLTLVGLGVGIAAAFALTRFLSSLLYGVKPTDPLTFVAVSLLLSGVATLACYIPARRATKVDPMVALRYE